MIYGISTHVVANETLKGDHLARIADAGFDTVELFANSHQIDCTNPQVLRDIAKAVDRNQLYVNSVHAPFYASLQQLKQGQLLDIGTSDKTHREFSVQEIKKTFVLASLFDIDYYVLHFPDKPYHDSLLKSIDELTEISSQLSVKLCFENIPGQNTHVSDIVEFLDTYRLPYGVCFDTGHSYLNGTLLSDIETHGSHFYTMHVHDNDGHGDTHHLPFSGAIDWTATMAQLRAAYYKWGFIIEVRNHGQVPLDKALADVQQTIIRFKEMEAQTQS